MIDTRFDRVTALPLEQIRANILDELANVRQWSTRPADMSAGTVSQVWLARATALEQVIKWIDGVCRCTPDTICDMCEAPDADENTCRNCHGRGWYPVVDVTAGAYRQPCGLCDDGVVELEPDAESAADDREAEYDRHADQVMESRRDDARGWD